MKRKTVRNHNDFLTTPGMPYAFGDYFIIKMKPAARKDARYGLVATKRTFRYAVKRNLAKRLLRDWIAYNENLMAPNADYIFIARNTIFECSRETGRRKMASLLKKLSKCKMTF